VNVIQGRKKKRGKREILAKEKPIKPRVDPYWVISNQRELYLGKVICTGNQLSNFASFLNDANNI